MIVLRNLAGAAGLVLVLCVLAAGIASADQERTFVRNLSIEAGEPATLTIWNRPIVTLRAAIDGRAPQERVSGISQRIEQLPSDAQGGDVTAAEVDQQGLSGFVIMVSGRLVLGLVPEDLDPEAGMTLEHLAQQTVQRLSDALQARSRQQHFPSLIRGAVLVLAATAVFAAAMWAITWLRARALRRAAASVHEHPLAVRGVNLRPYLRAIEQGAIKFTALACGLVAAYVWLTFALLQFPYTEPWGEGLGSWIGRLLANLGAGALGAIPGFLTVIIIFLMTRLVAQAADTFFRRVEMGWLRISWLEAETARATRRIAIVLIWIFALTVAYPYIPGSDSDAFKGVSVLIGLMISLGSAGFVNQVMSGFVIVYSRSFRPGEYVGIGNSEGTISEVGVLSTKMVTPTRHEITIPNAVLVGSQVTNYSRLRDSANGSITATTVTIGYDTPWRQVHAILILAAGRTEGVRKEPEPRILQRALSDFYVEYQLLFSIDMPETRRVVLSELHGHIQDVFNEYGVQIMSPHFVAQPDPPILVPKSAWHTAPAPAPVSAAETEPQNPGTDRQSTDARAL